VDAHTESVPHLPVEPIDRAHLAPSTSRDARHRLSHPTRPCGALLATLGASRARPVIQRGSRCHIWFGGRLSCCDS
jgi:hypothetical protein